MQSNKAVLSEWHLQSWEGRHHETSVRTMQDKQKPFILNEKIIHSWKGIMVRNRNRNVSHWLPPCPWNDFFIDLQRFTKEQCVSNSFNRTSNSRKQHTHVLFNCFTEQSNWQQDTGISHQAAPQLTDAFKRMLLLWNGRLKCKINVENNNKSVWFIARFADVMTKTED